MKTFHKKPMARAAELAKRRSTVYALNRTVSGRKDKNTKAKKKKTKNKPNIIRGKEVSVRLASDSRQIIYGRMKVGGTVTFVATNSDSKAYLITGDSTDQNQVVWTARTGGVAGNTITVEITLTGTFAATTVTVVSSTRIQIRLKSTSGNSNVTSAQLITAVRANASANALVAVQKLDANHNGLVFNILETALSYGGGTWLHQVITLAGHEVEEVSAVYLNNEQVTFGSTPDSRWGTGKWTGRVFQASMLGASDQPAQPDLIGQLPTLWSTDDRQRGCALSYLILVWDQNTFPSGNPEVSYLMKGKKCYDPRTATTVWTQNAALIWADFYTNSIYGMGVPYSLIDEPTLIQAANDCEEVVTLFGGGTEYRYTINGVFDTSESKETILEEILAAMGADLVIAGNKRYLYVAKYRTPESRTLTQDDLAGAVSLTTHISRGDTFNCIHGTFANPQDDYKEADIPAVKNATYIAADGGIERWEDVTLNFVTSGAQAQRLIRIDLERIRQGLMLKFPANIMGLQYKPLDNVNVLLPDIFGASPKLFEVVETEIRIDENGNSGVDLLMKETAVGVFDDVDDVTIDQAPNSTLPDPFTVPALASLVLASGTAHLYIRLDGTVQARLKASWTASTNEFVIVGGQIEVQAKRSSESVYTTQALIGGSQDSYYILDVQDSISYDVRIRAINSIGVESSWTTVTGHTVVGKTQPPSDVTGFTATLESFGIKFVWNAIADLDADLYEIRVGAGSWAAATTIFTGRGTNFTWEFKTAGSYVFWIKAIDTTGNYSTNADFENITILAPGIPASFAISIVAENAVFTWSPPATGSFAIKEYEIRYGASYGAGALVAVVTANNFTLPVNWGGARTFWIAGRDVAANTGTSTSVTTTIATPNPVQNLVSWQLNSNILLDWEDPAVGISPPTLPVQQFKIYKGDTFAGSTYLGNIYGSFVTYLERVGGTFTYWVVAVDTAGNVSAETATTIVVSTPSNFFIRDSQLLVPSTLSSTNVVVGGSADALYEDPNTIWAPVTLDTWDDWFTTNGWNTIQDAIDAGFDPWLSPTPSTATITFKVDYGVTFSSSYIDFTWLAGVLAGTVNITPTIAESEDDITYTTYSPASQVAVSGFRYVKYTLDFAAVDTNSLDVVNEILAKISLQIEEEYGQIAVVSTDVTGTEVTMVKDFLDVQDIQATMRGVLFATVVVNFVDLPNPTSFKLLAFDQSGARLSGDASYRVIGAVNP